MASISHEVLDTLDLPTFPQTASDLGGAACAQMLLGDPGLDQAALMHEAQELGGEPGWKMAPDALPKLLTAHAGRDFSLHPDGTVDQAMRRCAWSILKDRIAPAVLVWKCRHYALVTGFEADATPTTIDDPAWGLRGFYLRNPYGPRDHHIDAGSWKAQYQTGVGHGVWRAKRVVICSGAAAAANPKLTFEPERPILRRELHDPTQLPDAAIAAIAGDRFARHRRWQDAAKGTVPGTPMLVTRLNLPTDHYVIMPMLRDGRASLLLILDAYDGSYRESSLVDGDQPFTTDTARARLEAMLAQGSVAMETGGTPVPVWPETTAIFPSLGWRPCLESLSPYLPFLPIHSGNRQLHIRLDGKVFGDLSVRTSGA